MENGELGILVGSCNISCYNITSEKHKPIIEYYKKILSKGSEE